jgi:hypothetical protein
MTVISGQFDLDSVEWRHVTDSDGAQYLVDFEYSLLGYDLASQRLDMLLRFIKQGHCRRHRHIASTMTLVLDGEQHLLEMQPDGTSKSIVRKKGDYALASVDALPHDEFGGEEGGTVLYSMHAPEGILFEYFDENMENGWTLSIEEFVDSWNNETIYGWHPEAATTTAS